MLFFFSSEKIVSTAQPTFEDSQFGWLKMTVSTIIASTVGAVILISFIIIMVFRMKMKRQREQRIAQALESLYRHGKLCIADHFFNQKKNIFMFFSFTFCYRKFI